MSHSKCPCHRLAGGLSGGAPAVDGSIDGIQQASGHIEGVPAATYNLPLSPKLPVASNDSGPLRAAPTLGVSDCVSRVNYIMLRLCVHLRASALVRCCLARGPTR